MNNNIINDFKVLNKGSIIFSLNIDQEKEFNEIKYDCLRYNFQYAGLSLNNSDNDMYISVLGAVIYLSYIYIDEQLPFRIINENNKIIDSFDTNIAENSIEEFLSMVRRKCSQQVGLPDTYEKDNKIIDIHLINDFNIDDYPASDFVFSFQITDTELVLELYKTSSIKGDLYKNIGKYIINIVKELYTSSGSKLLKDIEYLDDEDKNILINILNKTEYKSALLDYPVHSLIERQVRKTPEAPAIIHNGISISYKEMNEKANKIARYILDHRLVNKKNGIIGILFEPSIEMIITILAIWKSGNAYVPLDPEYPDDRIKMILDDCNSDVVIKGGTVKLSNDDVIILEYSDLMRESNDYDNLDLNLNVGLNDLCYVIFTSGSTGKPKGVMIEHKQSVNTVIWYGEMCELNEETNCLLSYNYTSDPSVEDIYSTLAFGSKLYIPPKEVFIDKRLFCNYINQNKINVFNFVPRVVQTMLCGIPKLESIKYVLSGGDVLTDFVKDELISKGYIVINDYGPTETSVDCLSLKCNEKKVTLGYPINNMKVYVLDNYKNLKPVGAVGELYVSGVGIARGYINRDDLTQKAFFEDPFCKGNRMYKTGDVAKWNSDGEIEFFGRKDSQVKINGYRIELHEIEHELLSLDGIKEAVVASYEDEIKYLCVFYTTEGEELSEETIKEHLKGKLPGYMIPRYYIRIDSIPLTLIGKTDYKKLKSYMNNKYTLDDSIFANYKYSEILKNLFISVCEQFKIPPKINFDLTLSENGFDSFSMMVIFDELCQLYDYDYDYEEMANWSKERIRDLLSKFENSID